MATGPYVNSVSKLLGENGLEFGLDRPIKQNKVLVVFDEFLCDKDTYINSFSGPGVKKIHFGNIDKENKESLYDAILCGVMGHVVPCNMDLMSAFLELLVPSGLLLVKSDLNTRENLYKTFRMCGFLNVVLNYNTNMIAGNAPTYKIGSSDKITVKSETKENVISAWKLDDNNSETISEDDLLEADDLKKPVSSSLRVCATTKKAKACKDCSCGLAEELAAANKPKDAPKPDTSNAKSSCGSCYLGDAFRCASCPYLGMPAFKPGEKVQLAGNLLQDDL